MIKETDWKWYAGANEEEFPYGPFDTREDAIDEASGYGLDCCYVIEAFKNPLKLSDYVHAINIIEHADESAGETRDESGYPIFEMSAGEQMDLEASIKSAVDAWQERHGLVFEPFMFTGSRNREYVDLSGKEAAE